MARVFLPTEIKNGHVPTEDGFYYITHLCERTLEQHIGIIGGFFFGSGLSEELRLTSDLDLCIVYKKDQENAVLYTLFDLQVQAKKRFVPLNLVFIDNETSQSPYSFIGPQFGIHLVLATEQKNIRFIKSNPRKYLENIQITVEEDCRNYMRSRLQKLLNGLVGLGSRTMDVHEYYDFLGSVIRMPMHIARTTLVFHDCQLCTVKSQEVMERYQQLLVKLDASDVYEDLFCRLLETSSNYSTETERIVNKGYEYGVYQSLIKDIEGSVPQMLAFVRKNSELCKTQAETA